MTYNLPIKNKLSTPHKETDKHSIYLAEQIIKHKNTKIVPTKGGREEFLGTNHSIICSAGTDSDDNAWLAIKSIKEITN